MFAVRNIFSRPERLAATMRELADAGELPRELADNPDPLGFLVHAGGASSVIDAAYRFVRHEPGVDVVLFGTGDVAHLHTNIASLLKPPLPEADRDRLASGCSAIWSASASTRRTSPRCAAELLRSSREAMRRQLRRRSRRMHMGASTGTQPQRQRCRYGSQAYCQARPQSDRAVTEGKGEKPAAGKADRPIPDRGDQHRHGGVTVAAQRADRDHLHPVEHLKQRGNEENLQRYRDKAPGSRDRRYRDKARPALAAPSAAAWRLRP